MTAVAILHGPNLNLLGSREPEVYGSMTLADIETELRASFEAEHKLNFFLSNHLGAMLDILLVDVLLCQ